MRALNRTTRQITVAGAAGLAGSHLLPRLSSSAASVRAVYRHREPSVLAGIVPFRADLADAAACRAAVRGSDTVICLAAETGGSGWSANRWWSHAQDNLRIWTNLAEACRAEGVDRVFFALSALMYRPSELPLSEESLDGPAGPEGEVAAFGWANRYFEKLCAEWQRKDGASIALARVSNLYGPHDHFEEDRAHVIPALIRRACRQEDPFTILGDGKPIRDVLYAGDFADAVLRWLERPVAGIQTVNVGSGTGRSIDAIARAVLRAAGHNPTRISYNGAASGHLDTRVLNISRARELWGWNPQVTLEEGLKKTVEWWRGQREGATLGASHENSQL